MAAGEAPPASPVPLCSGVYKRHERLRHQPLPLDASSSTDDNEFPQKGEDEDNRFADRWLGRKREHYGRGSPLKPSNRFHRANHRRAASSQGRPPHFRGVT
jgi:hypothetical protein